MARKNDVKSIIESMEIGEEKSFAICTLSNVRAYASNVGIMLGRKYKTFTDKDNKEIVVTRIE